MQSTLSPDERRTAILALLGEAGRLPVADLATRFETSEDSIRRDLRHLAAAGLIRRVHGAVLPSAAATPFTVRSEQRQAAKARIGAAAAALLPDGGTLLVDGGTTPLAVLAALPEGRRFTIVTTSLPAALAAADREGVSVVLVGGSLDRDSRTTVGAAALDAVRAIRADVCLLGLCSVDPVAGVTATGFEEARIKRAMIDAAATTLAVATADKLGTASPHLVAPAARLDRLVTEADAAPGLVEALRAAGVDVHLA